MYLFVKVLTRFSLWLFSKRLGLYNPERLQIKTPHILGCNHPNSFLDAIIVGGLMSQRVHFITRSGVFKHPIARKILRSVNMIPVYRMSDGKHQLSNNDATFEEVRAILKRGEHVLIFVEGFCKHQTTVQTPLKKGAPRMLLQAWADGLDVKLLPVWLRYSSFTDFPKELDVNLGKPFGKEVVKENAENGVAMLAINKQTEHQLEHLSKINNRHPASIPQSVLFLPAVLAMITHVLFYFPLQRIAWKLRADQYYDSILFVLLAFLYPFYLLMVGFIVWWFFGVWWSLGAVLLMPLLAKAYTLWK
jgi:1-acyl-sn-glycerol-3-phosphate acyltransferase